MGKRKNGEGSWGKKTIKGVVYVYYRDSNGHYTYGKTDKEVNEKRTGIKEKRHVINTSKSMTLGDYMSAWLYNKKFKEIGISLEPTTFDCYESALTKRLYNHKIANLQLSALTKEQIMLYLKDLSKTYSRGSISKTWQVIRMALTDDDFDLVDRVPEIKFERVRVPNERNVAVKAKEHEFTSNEDMDALYNEALRKYSNGKYVYGSSARLLAFIMYSGLRVGEGIGLKWRDVDLKKGLITINQSYAMTHERDENGNAIGWKYIEKAPKSESSNATIPVRERGLDILDLMDDETPNHKSGDLIFLSSNGTPLTKRHILHTLRRMLEGAGIDKDYTVHDLRHGYGSILFQEGVDIMTISKLLRHKDIQTTANIYVTTTPETLQQKLFQVDRV